MWRSTQSFGLVHLVRWLIGLGCVLFCFVIEIYSLLFDLTLLYCLLYCTERKRNMEGDKNCDLTPLMAPYLDVHMMSPLLDFLREVS